MTFNIFFKWKTLVVGLLLFVLVGVVVFCCKPREDGQVLTHIPSRNFRICFTSPKLESPLPAQLGNMSRISSSIDRLVQQSRLNENVSRWIVPLILHESGGDPRAVSATGCAGLLAFASPTERVPACCRKEDDDFWRYEYDLCNAEYKKGLFCDFNNDSRFHPERAIERGISDLRRFSTMLEASSDADVATALTIFWNAGDFTITGFPRNLRSAREMIEKINFTGYSPYQRWSVYSHANKLVEVFDYVSWLSFLDDSTLDKFEVGAPYSYVCIDYRPSERDSASRSHLFFLSDLSNMSFKGRLAIKRLKFGIYYEDYVWVSW